MNIDRDKLEPAYGFDSSDSSVLLNRGRIEIRTAKGIYAENGEVRLDLLPTAGLHLYVSLQQLSFIEALEIMINRAPISLTYNGVEVDGFAIGLKGDGPEEEATLKWSPSREPISAMGNDSTQMVRVVFHLFNFVDLIGTRRTLEQSGTTTVGIEHVDMAFGEWSVEVKSLLTTGDNFKALEAQGGYRMTHVGRIAKADGSPFSGKEAEYWLGALRMFLSFTKGAWCAAVCPVGYDATGNRVWECWSSPREDWISPLSWFDSHHSSQIASLFPGFMARWANDSYRQALEEVIYWYQNANHPARGVDAGVILAQAAIERLSYEFAVRDRRLLTAEGFKDLRASDKFRLLFSSLGIPLSLPPETPQILALADRGKMNWLDAAHALAEVRNSVVHPEHKSHGQFGGVYYEAWNLGLWYLEMSLLAICSYSGTYRNRLKRRWHGEVADVPWKK